MVRKKKEKRNEEIAMTNVNIEHSTFNIERRIEEMLNTEKERRVGHRPALLTEPVNGYKR